MPNKRCKYMISELVRQGNKLVSRKRRCKNNAMTNCQVCYVHRLQCALVK